MKKVNGLLILIIILLTLTACWDKVELESRSFVVTLGIDKYTDNKSNEKSDSDSGGEIKRYEVSMSLPDAKSIAESGGGEIKTVKSAIGGTLATSMHMVDSYLSKKLYFGHTKAVILGEELLNDPLLLIEAVDALERNREMNRKMMILATEQRALEILEVKSSSEPLVGMYISNFYKNNANTQSAAISQDLENLVQNLRATGNTLIPKITSVDIPGSDNDEKEVRIGGACVIKGFSIAGWLDEKQSRGCLWIRGEGNGAQITAELDNSVVPIRISKNKTDITFYESDDKLICRIYSYAEGNIEEFTLLSDSLAKPDVLQSLADSYGGIINGEILSVMNILQNEFKADVLMLSELLRKHNWNLYKKYSSDWETVFSDMEIDVSSNVKITNTGAIH